MPDKLTHRFRCQEFVNSHNPDKILPEEEYDMLHKEIKLVMDDKSRQVFVGEWRIQLFTQPNPSAVEEVQLDADGREITGGDMSELPAQTVYNRKYDDEALKLFRVAVLDKRRKMHLMNEAEVSKRWQFEEGVSRCRRRSFTHCRSNAPTST